MDIKWTYYFIIAMYCMLITLRAINSVKEQEFIKNQSQKPIIITIIKKDFFTSVTLACILFTLIINCLAISGGRPVNIHTIIVTALMIGLTFLNSFTRILLIPKEAVFVLGETIKQEDIDKISVKSGKLLTRYKLMLNKEVDTYNWISIKAFGKNKDELKSYREDLIS